MPTINLKKPPAPTADYKDLLSRVTSGKKPITPPPAAAPPRMPLPEGVAIPDSVTVGATVPAEVQAMIAQIQAEQASAPTPEPSTLTPENLQPLAIEQLSEEQLDQVSALLADRIMAHPAPKPQAPASEPEPPPSTPEPAPAKPVSETGADAPATAFCPHCGGDISLPAGPEPSYDEKLVYLTAFIGGKCYQREVPLFGGRVTVTFRTLTLRELDTAYIQAYADRKAGRITNDLDYWERVNRYRMLMQLVSFRARGANGFLHELPAGLNPTANPAAGNYWVCDEPPEGETELPQLETHIIAEILKTEGLYRIVNSACAQFNRTAARLEVNAQNPDFWQPIAPPS